MEWYKRYTNRSNHGQLFKAGFWGGVVFDALCDSSAAYDLNGRLPKIYAEPEYLQRQLRLTEADIGFRHDPSRDARDASCDARDGVTQLLIDAVRMCFEAQLIRLEGDLVVIDGWERRQPKPSQSDAARSRKYREKKKNERLNKAAFEPFETVTNRHEASRDASRGVTPRVEENREEKNRIEDHVDSQSESNTNNDFLKAWNEKANVGLARVERLTDKRKAAIKRFLKAHTEADWERIITEINGSDFLSGRGGQTWKASFDWAINVNNAVKVLEGNYRNTQATQTAQNISLSKRFDQPMTSREKAALLLQTKDNHATNENR